MSSSTRRAFGVVMALALGISGCEDAKDKTSPAAQPAVAKPAAAKPAAAKPAAAKPAAKGLDAAGNLQLGADDRCPVCGMRVDEHKKFASAIELSDATTYYFCGTGCMIKSWLHPEVFLGRPKTELKRAVTREYFAGKAIDALKARWVAGSDVVGPMGPAIVPLKDDADLETFKQRHGGKATFALSELDDAKWAAMTGRKATMRPHKK